MEDNLIKKYRAQTLLPTLEEVMGDLDFTTNYRYPKICAYLVDQKICSVREFNRERYVAYVVATLGALPESAAELIDAVVDNYQIETAPTSSLALIWTCPITGERRPCDEAKIVQEAHRINDTILNNRFREANLVRAVR